MYPTVRSETDVLVIGAGVAGVSAACAAASKGAAVRLVDQNGFLGGTLVSGMVGGFCGMFSAKKNPGARTVQIVGGMGDVIKNRVNELGGLSSVNKSRYFDTYRYDPVILQIALDGLASEYGVSVTSHTMLIDVVTERDRVISAETASKSGREIITAKYYIDASGDADAVVMAGGAFRKDDDVQPGSFNFRMSNVDPGKGVPNFAELAAIMKDESIDVKLRRTRQDPMFLNSPTMEQVICSFSRIPVDGTDAVSLTNADFEGRRQVLPTAEFIKKRFPAFENAYVSGMASQIGIRQTRVIVGEETLTKEDVLEGKKQRTRIGRCAWPVERHIHDDALSEITPINGEEFYDIPFGVTIPRGLVNMLAAGRCVSSDKAANASVRVFGPCSVTGTAAGMAAAMCSDKGLRDIRELDIDALQRELISFGAVL
jgi:hypothetical protein